MRPHPVSALTRRAARAIAAALALLLLAEAQAQQPPAQPAPTVPRPAVKAKAKAPPEPKAFLEQRALEILKTAAARLAAAKSMTFTATVTYEYPSRLGPPIAFTTRSLVAAQKPDRLVVVTPGDGPASELYLDGSRLMVYAPAENLVAIAEGRYTIETALKLLFEDTGTYYPFTDLVVDDPGAVLSSGLKNAFYVGRSDTVGGVATDMIVYSTPEIFVQAWVGVDDKLPRRLRATFAKDPHQLRHQLDIADWRLDVALPPEGFTSDKAKAAPRIAVARPIAPPPPPKRPAALRAAPAAAPKTP